MVVDAVTFSKSTATIHQSTRCNITEDLNLH